MTRAPGPTVVVVGSANTDLVLDVPRLPRPGETLLAGDRRTAAGGKGANQAVATARDGRHCRFVAAVGDDPEGEALLETLATAGVDTALVRRSDRPTGLAVVLLDPDAQNAILVAAGANATLGALTEADRVAVRDAAVLLCQLEVPLPVVQEAVSVARGAGVLTVLNAAPCRPLPDELWAGLDVLVVNESEARELAGLAPDADALEAAQALLARVDQVVVTLGADGAAHLGRDGARTTVPAPAVRAVDTTGAGDTFCGVLASALAVGSPLQAALARAVTAASLSVQRAGAVPSIPTAAQTDERLAADAPA